MRHAWSFVVRTHLTHTIFLWSALLLAPLGLGCGQGVNPQPLPVSDTDFELRTNDLELARSPTTTEIHGTAGAAAPVGALVRAFAMDATGVSAQATVGADGSFLASLGTASATEFHLELEAANRVSVPVELESRGNGLVVLPKPPCLSDDVIGALVQQTNGSRPATFTVTLTETCGRTQAIAVSLHDGTSFVLRSAPTSIGANQSVSLLVDHSSSPSGEDVDLLIVTGPDPTAGGLGVSLHAVTP
jgi:hypothetical protein